MKAAARAAKVGNKMISCVAVLVILLLLLYGGYSLWDTAILFRKGFADEELLKFKPTDGAGANPTLAELRQINPDVCGWITIDDTNIDHPVVQGKTNMEYINKDVYGEFSFAGSIFLDYRNKADFSDPYSLLYGHHMAQGAMFGDVGKFAEKEFFEKHKAGTLFLPDSTYRITLFACIETNASDMTVFNPGIQNQSSVNTFLEQIQSKAVQYRNIEITEEDRLIGLSTCAMVETNGRTIVFGRLDK